MSGDHSSSSPLVESSPTSVSDLTPEGPPPTTNPPRNSSRDRRPPSRGSLLGGGSGPLLRPDHSSRFTLLDYPLVVDKSRTRLRWDKRRKRWGSLPRSCVQSCTHVSTSGTLSSSPSIYPPADSTSTSTPRSTSVHPVCRSLGKGLCTVIQTGRDVDKDWNPPRPSSVPTVVARVKCRSVRLRDFTEGAPCVKTEDPTVFPRLGEGVGGRRDGTVPRPPSGPLTGTGYVHGCSTSSSTTRSSPSGTSCSSCESRPPSWSTSTTLTTGARSSRLPENR